MQPAGQQIFAAVADQFEECVIGFGNPVKLAGNDAGDGGFRGERPETRARLPQLLVPLVALAESRAPLSQNPATLRPHP